MLDSSKLYTYCMLLSCFMPVILAGLAKIWGGFTAKDNSQPRVFLNGLQGKAMRANAAQQNSFEVLPLFLSAVLLCVTMAVPVPLINLLAVAFILFRVLYAICYVVDWSALRSLAWMLSVMCCVGLYMLSVTSF